MLRCALCGVKKLLGDTSDPPPDSEFEVVASNAFAVVDQDGDNKITIQEFLKWCRNNREIMTRLEAFNAQVVEAQRDIESDDSADEVCRGVVRMTPDRRSPHPPTPTSTHSPIPA